MNETKTEEYRKKLERERMLISSEVKRNEAPVDFGGDADDETDEMESFGNQLAIVNDLKGRLGEVDIALGKIQSGKYGICEKCGKEIEEEILDADPESIYCKNDKIGKVR